MQWDDAGTLEGLTESQAEAVRQVEGPLLVLAGPGSGKTTVVTRRIAAMLGRGIPPWQILALTFTNKAAREMRERVERAVGVDLAPRGLTVATFHGFCARLLRRYGPAAGVDPGYTIYDTADQRAAAKRAIVQADLSERNFPPAAILARISQAKNQLQDAETFAATATDFHSRSIAKAYRAYEKIMRASNAVDFDDLLLRVALLLQRDAGVLVELQERYRYLMIDEYQDTNHAQFTIARQLGSKHRNVMVVGDPDQSIYAWRGADIRNILEFEAVYPEASVVPLGRNFRSTGHIVAVADALIRNNGARKDKRLYTELEDGDKPTVAGCIDEHSEARRVVDTFRRLHETSGVPYRSMAVLYRTNALSRVVEDAMRHAHLPYVIARGTAFYDRREIRDALAYLRLVVNAGDEVALRRIVNVPPRGIGKTTLDRLDVHASASGISLDEAMVDAAGAGTLAARAVKSVTAFSELVAGWREAAGAPSDPSDHAMAELVERVVRESGLEAALRTSGTDEDLERLENLEELVNAAAEFLPSFDDDPGPVDDDGRPRGTSELAAGAGVAEPAGPSIDDDGLDLLFGGGVDGDGPGADTAALSAAAAESRDADGLVSVRARLAAFLEQIALVSDADAVDPDRGAITLMTLHAAKGLEFDAVAVVGLEEGLLPHSRSIEAPGDDGIEEERRLLFVGITRARKHLLVTSAQSRAQRGFRERTIASRFLRELPADHLVTIEPPAAYSAPGSPGSAGDDPFLANDDFPGWDAVQVDPEGAAGGVRPGALVRHRTFGLGRVESISGRRHGGRALVEFERVGRKTLLLDHAPLEVVDPADLG